MESVYAEVLVLVSNKHIWGVDGDRLLDFCSQDLRALGLASEKEARVNESPRNIEDSNQATEDGSDHRWMRYGDHKA